MEWVAILIILLIIGALIGGNTFGEMVRGGCGCIVIIMLISFVVVLLAMLKLERGSSSPTTPTRNMGSTITPNKINETPTSENTMNSDSTKWRITAPDELNVREGPGKGYAAIDKVYNGQVVDVYEIENGWIRVNEGWVNGEYAEPIE